MASTLRAREIRVPWGELRDNAAVTTRSWLLSLVGICSGCDEVWSIDRVPPPVDAAPPIDTAPIDATVCPGNYVTIPGQATKYRYGTPDRLWDEAAIDCNNDNPGTTHLVTFDDLDELVAVRTIVAHPIPYNLHVGYARDTVAAGGNDRVFYAVTGETLDLSSQLWDLWQQGEPNNYMMIETIVFIEHDKTLMDGEPSRSQFYVCECDGRPATRTFMLR
jgi:hypothetical protein